MKCLVLNADLMPLNLTPISSISWKDAVCLVYQEKATVLFEHDEEIHSQNLTWKKPSVIVLRKYVYFKRHAKFSKTNIKIRDNYTCAYCGNKFNKNKLTIDHIHPSSKGGQSEWLNCVTACKPCNHNKSDKTHILPKYSHPYVPTYYELARKHFANLTLEHEEWQEFLPKFLMENK